MGDCDVLCEYERDQGHSGRAMEGKRAGEGENGEAGCRC